MKLRNLGNGQFLHFSPKLYFSYKEEETSNCVVEMVKHPQAKKGETKVTDYCSIYLENENSGMLQAVSQTSLDYYED